MSPKYSLLENWQYRIFVSLFRLLGLVPLNTRRVLATCVGNLWYATDRRHRLVAYKNLARAQDVAIKSRKRYKIVRSVFHNYVTMFFEIGWVERQNKEDLREFIEFRHLNRIHDALGLKRGLVLITSHTGNWELLSLIAMAVPNPLHIVYRPADFKAMDRFLFQFRSRYGARMIPKTDSLKRLYACLRRNEIIGLVMDQHVGWRKGVLVDFFGHGVWTTKGPAFLALLTGAPVIPLTIKRKKHRFVVDVGSQIPTVRTGDRDKDIAVNTQNYNRAIENIIREHPDPWMWTHRRWKNGTKTNGVTTKKPV